MRQRESFGPAKGRISMTDNKRSTGIPRRKSTTAKDIPKQQPAIRKGTGTKRDPPSRDPSHVLASINEYLTKKAKVTPFPKRESLNSKHYREASKVLFKLIDPNFQGFSNDKFHIEFKDLMEVAGYPYTVRPNDLQSFGAAQRLGPALDPLFWMIEVLKMDEAYEEQGMQELEENADLGYHMFFFNFLRSAYARWMEEGDQPVSQLDQEMTGILAKDTMRVEKQHAELARLLEEKKRECEELELQVDPRQSLITEVNELEREVAQRSDQLQKIDRDHQSAMENLDALKKTLSSETAKLKDIEGQLQSTRDEIGKKSVNTDDLQVMLQQIRQIEDDTDQQVKKRQDLEREIMDAEDSRRNCSAALAQLNDDLNASLKDLGVSQLVHVNTSGDTIEDILGIGFDELRNIIERQRPSPQKVNREQNRIASERAQMQRERDELESRAQELASEIKGMTGGGRKDMNKLKRLHETLVDEINDMQRDLDSEKSNAEKTLRSLESYFAEFQLHVRDGLSRLSNEFKSHTPNS